MYALEARKAKGPYTGRRQEAAASLALRDTASCGLAQGAGAPRRRLARIVLIYTVSAVSAPSPLELFELPFMRTALAELGLLAVAGGTLGAFVVLRRLAFYSHAVGTAAFPGLVVAEGAGIAASAGGLAAALGFAGAVERAGTRSRDAGDAVTGLLLVAALAVGVILASDVFESGAAVDRLLFGTLLGLDGVGPRPLGRGRRRGARRGAGPRPRLRRCGIRR